MLSGYRESDSWSEDQKNLRSYNTSLYGNFLPRHQVWKKGDLIECSCGKIYTKQFTHLHEKCGK